METIMSKLMLTSLAGVALAASFAVAPAVQAAPNGVKVSLLTCSMLKSWDFIRANHTLACSYRPADGEPPEPYIGQIISVGVNLGHLDAGKIVWAVLAPSSDVGPGALQGDYVGVTAGVTVGVGLDASVFLGGMDKSIALQPISVEGNEGMDVAAGLSRFKLATFNLDP
jgi:hypothetical protein